MASFSCQKNLLPNILTLHSVDKKQHPFGLLGDCHQKICLMYFILTGSEKQVNPMLELI